MKLILRFVTCAVGLLVLPGVLVVAWPQMVHQATSDDGDGWSGACPGYESHAEAWEMSGMLPPTCELTSDYFYEQKEDE